MKTIIFLTAGSFLALSLSVPALANIKPNGLYTLDAMQDQSIDKRRKPRIKGGSGCDDPRDLIEHPECRPAASLQDGEMNEADELLLIGSVG